MHHIHREAPWEEVWQAYEVLVQQGKVLYAGSSNFAGWHIVKANEAARKRNFMGLVSEQSHYHLLNRNIELEVIPACEDYGLGLIPWSPLAGGLLAGKPKPGDQGRRSEGDDRWQKHASQLEAWEALSKELGEEPADVAIAWQLHQPAVTAPIVGPRTMAQLEGGVHALDIALDEAVLKKIGEIFPGRKTAPEDYAW
jgi:aryl-alcohol dehydrogenase-like predicted oxidoreductase